MVKISKARVDLENARLEQAVVKRYHETVVTPSISSGTLTLDISSGNVFSFTHDANITTFNVTNPAATGTNTSITIIRTKDDSATPRTIFWPSVFSWPGGEEPTLTQTAQAVDIFTAFTFNGGSSWFAFAVGLDMR